MNNVSKIVLILFDWNKRSGRENLIIIVKSISE